VLVTGGAGFIGRWVVEKLLMDGNEVYILDNLSNGSFNNIRDLLENYNRLYFKKGDIKDISVLNEIYSVNKFDICYHLAASINVQDSIENPRATFNNDTLGTFNVLEKCRQFNVKIVFMSTCMVYDKSNDSKGITEEHKIKPASPYAGTKIAGENLVISYYHAYQLPVVIVRPFNTYGPYQKTNGEGGVVAIFIKNKLDGKNLKIYGDGTQTRDLLYVEDCARFVVDAGYCNKANGEIINAGFGEDISINELAELIVEDNKIQHINHIHPQSEIQKLLCNYDKAKRLLKWEPKVNLKEGIKRTESWIKNQF